jgi:type III secretory pathway component EscT
MDTLQATDSYASLLLALPKLQPMTVLSLFFLTLARLLPIIAIAPFLGSRTVPMTIRMMFGVALVAIFLPQNLMSAQSEISFNMYFALLMVKELLIGVVIGFLAAVPFYTAQMAGALITHQAGASSLQISDPSTQIQTSQVGLLYNYVLIVLFFYLNGPFFFFNGLASAYQLIPIEGLISPSFFSLDVPFWKQMVALLHHMMTLAIQLAAPALIGILLTDMFLGIANRLAPQVQIVFLGISLKAWVGIALLTAAWSLVLRVLGENAIKWTQTIQQFIEQIGYFFVK